MSRARRAHAHEPKGPVPWTRPIREVAFWTAASRFAGFFRDLVIAAVLGAGPVVEAFVVALRLPNLFRRIFAEGAFNTAFIPLYSHRRAEAGDVQARAFAESTLSLLLLAMTLLLGVALVFMPQVVSVLAPGFEQDSDTRRMAILFSRLTFGYLLLTSLVAWAASLCNAHGKFAAGAIAPVFFNLTLVLALAIFARASPQTIGTAMATAVTLSGILQLVFIVYACRKATGMRLRLPRPRASPELRRLLALMGPVALSVGVFQVNFLVATAVASNSEGGISHLYYAERLYQLPLALIGIAIASVLLPNLAEKLNRGEVESAEEDFNRALEMTLVLILPATLGLILLREPIVSVLFERGAFQGADARATAAALGAFALGLPAYALVRIMQPAFFAREDTKTPLRATLFGAAVNLILTWPLYLLLGTPGVALATAAGGWTATLALYASLCRRLNWWPDARLARRGARTAAATAGMGLATVAGGALLAPGMETSSSEGARWSVLLGLIFVCAVVYFVLVLALGAVRRRELTHLLRRG